VRHCTVSNIIKAKRAGGMAQVTGHLPSKHKALNSNNRTIRKRKRKKEKERKKQTNKN
jgi:hypothetical protein